MTDSPVRCPNCGQWVPPGSGTGGGKLRCQKCDFEFLAQTSVWAPVMGSATPGSPAAAADVPLRLRKDPQGGRCPHCSADNTTEALFCGSCGADLQMGRGGGPSPVALRRGGPHPGRWQVWSMGLVAVLAVAAIAAWLTRSVPAPAPVKSPEPSPPPPPAVAAREEARPPVPEPPPGPIVEEEHYANGALMGRGPILQAAEGRRLKHGMWSNYWSSGALNTYGLYENGEKVGIWPFFVEDGRGCITNRFRPPTRPALARVPPAGGTKASPRPTPAAGAASTNRVNAGKTVGG